MNKKVIYGSHELPSHERHLKCYYCCINNKHNDCNLYMNEYHPLGCGVNSYWKVKVVKLNKEVR